MWNDILGRIYRNYDGDPVFPTLVTAPRLMHANGFCAHELRQLEFKP